ncbi:MAG: tRNA (N6-isopentenyl adenosine(37)-C2)-methylthiotransferase MiaB [Myxococcota bacterium]
MSGSFHLRVFGCQMNQHDAEKIENLLWHEGLRPAADPASADVYLVHTCSVRDRAEHKLYSELGGLCERKRERPDLVIGVGGCVAQQEGAELLRRFPALDFVFGSQNLRHVPAMIRAARGRVRTQRVDWGDDPTARFELPERHPEFPPLSPGRAFVTVMEGCDLFCSFCVVPRTRGREVSRPSHEIEDEVRRLAARGVREVTLLGQTVNAYGRPRPGRTSGEVGFSELLRRVAGVPGIERVRFTSPHPAFMDESLIRAYREIPELCPHLHLPVQSGSSAVLRAMNRRYTRETYLSLIDQLRLARPDLCITTDWIVGFPGESDSDFEQTLSLCRRVGFVDSFSFKYSPRPGTAALRRKALEVPARVAAQRLSELQELQAELTLAAHRSRVGERATVLVEGPSRHGPPQVSGRCPYNRIVNFSACGAAAPGELLEVEITGATPHSLLGRARSRPTEAAPIR